MVLEAQYQSALTAAVRNINATRDKVSLSPPLRLVDVSRNILCCRGADGCCTRAGIDAHLTHVQDHVMCILNAIPFLKRYGP